jgi:hypothetical protein
MFDFSCSNVLECGFMNTIYENIINTRASIQKLKFLVEQQLTVDLSVDWKGSPVGYFDVLEFLLPVAGLQSSRSYLRSTTAVGHCKRIDRTRL